MTAVTWADIRAGDIVRLKGDDWTVTAALLDEQAVWTDVTIQRQGRVVGPREMPAKGEVERVDPTDVHTKLVESAARAAAEPGRRSSRAAIRATVGETVRAAEGDLPAAEALATVQLGAVVIGRKDGAQPWQVVGVDETMIHAHLYNFHGIDVVAVGSAAEAMALHLADHAASVKAGSFVEHEHVA